MGRSPQHSCAFGDIRGEAALIFGMGSPRIMHKERQKVLLPRLRDSSRRKSRNLGKTFQPIFSYLLIARQMNHPRSGRSAVRLLTYGKE